MKRMQIYRKKGEKQLACFVLVGIFPSLFIQSVAPVFCLSPSPSLSSWCRPSLCTFVLTFSQIILTGKSFVPCYDLYALLRGSMAEEQRWRPSLSEQLNFHRNFFQRLELSPAVWHTCQIVISGSEYNGCSVKSCYLLPHVIL